ncbi:MAG: MBL fold metallo-hydrolase [Gammaproteobacteria bacterium]|nr:MBL fold metallo-hydrolase [Gammaproteobacteria bacterium]
MSEVRATQLSYLGWSGFRLHDPAGIELYLDPPGGTVFSPDQTAHILITHGHPEHVQGTLEHLRNPARALPVVIAAGEGVCRHLRRHARHDADRFQVCTPGQHFELAGYGIDVFKWTHMPLLPPGLSAKLHHVRRLCSRPRLAARIVLAGIIGPWPYPMLGFRLVRPGRTRILLYGEGLHRQASPRALAQLAAELPADVLLAAVEPEDLAILPDLIARLGTRKVALYQAHQPWRMSFGMPLADLDALAATLVHAGHEALLFPPGAASVVIA